MLFLLTLAATAFAQPTSGVGYPNVAAALAALQAKPGVSLSRQGGWMIVDDKPANAIWSFTPPGHPAHPAVVKRTIVSKDGMVGIEMTALCQAAKGPCDALMEEFKGLNEQMRQAMRGKSATAAAGAQAGWQASSAQVQAVEQQSQAYFAAKDGRRLEDAYKMQSPALTHMASFDSWRSDTVKAQATIGAVVRRDIKKITWYKDPPKGPPGTYAAVDFSSEFANTAVHCGYLVWREQGDGSFLLVREEENYIDKATEQTLTPEARQGILARLGCKAMQ
ncbi:DUF4019 domain-containing protein [Massilia sp. DWR3-1-1]|uniref:DUF4019 domain-containing protein n=1 Tax=Massilia sp. DWR3-1-1 TaxID=2804559 RepID=UPI003CFAB5FE